MPYVCDADTDEVRIKFFGNWNEEGLALLQQYAGEDNLSCTVGPEDTDGFAWRTVRTCNLSAGVVQIVSTPVLPRSPNLGTGPCNEWDGGVKVQISFQGRQIGSYALQEDCSSEEIIDAINVRGSDGQVTISRKSIAEWYPRDGT